MNIYKLTQRVNRGYDTYDAAIVAAETEDDARLIRPDHSSWDINFQGAWVERPSDVNVTFIGVAVEGITSGIILASFNAG